MLKNLENDTKNVLRRDGEYGLCSGEYLKKKTLYIERLWVQFKVFDHEFLEKNDDLICPEYLQGKFKCN